MEKKFLLAFTLSLLILFAYSRLIMHLYGPPSKPGKYNMEHYETKNVAVPSATQNQISKADETTETPLILETDKLKLFIDPREGAIQKVLLKEYVDDAKEPIELVKVGDRTFFIGNLWFISPNIGRVLYEKVEQDSHSINFRTDLPGGVTLEKRIEFLDSSYALKLSLRFRNQTTHAVPLYYHLVAASHLEPQPQEARFFEALSFSNGKKRTFNLHKAMKNPISSDEKTVWVALQEKYFSLILKPDTELSGFEIMATEDKKGLSVRVRSTPQNIPAGGEVTENYLLYFGPNKLEELKKLGPWAEGVLDYGIFGAIAKILLGILAYIHRVVNSYGLSIILLTIFVSAILFPLTSISYNSMKKMKLIQPEVNKIREMYKEKPQKLNKELMGLYKRQKVNPLGGCLPMLIQMPIFIAFYSALIHSIELKGAPFLFIKDLSLPDRAVPLPFQLGPFGNAINVLPILMAFAMFIQQKLSASVTGMGAGPEADAQRTMTMMMPFVFGVMFYGLPSGLVLYWLTNNIIMIITQRLLFSR